MKGVAMNEVAGAVEAQVRKEVRNLLSESPSVREQTISSLTQHAAEAADAVVELIRKKAGHPQVLMALEDALVGLGKPAVEVILEALRAPARYERPEDLNVANALLDALYEIDDKRCAPRLVEVLKKVAAMEREKQKNGELASCDPELVRVKIHEMLADWHDRGGLDDLMKLLGDGRGRVRNGVVSALSEIGDRTALVPLLRLHAIEEPVSSSGEQEIKEAFREIVRRENVARDDAIFAKLGEAERARLEKLYPTKLKSGNGSGNGHK
jgi:HEAT repeat protein